MDELKVNLHASFFNLTREEADAILKAATAAVQTVDFTAHYTELDLKEKDK